LNINPIMKKYFLHNGTESAGPFSFDELRAMNITKTTPVWFEGMEKWKYAKDVEELYELVAVTPPPFQVEEVIAPQPPKKVSNAAFLGLSKNGFIAVVAIIFIISTVVFNIIQNNRSEELEAKNKKTELENRQFLLQQKEIEEQKKLIEEQKLAEEERTAREKKQTIIDRIAAIENEMAVTKDNLDTTKEKLAKASNFKVLRTSNEKSEELKKIQLDIESFEKELEDLEAEQNRLNLELEKIK
jgi:preprotein translocase subunit SecG